MEQMELSETRLVFLLLLSFHSITGINGQTCAGKNLGDESEKANVITTVSDYRFLVSSDLVICHGQINSYDFWQKNNICNNIQFQIWRPVDVAAGRYMMIGANAFTRATTCNNGLVTLNPATIDEVPVQPGDVYGWTDTSNTGATQRLLTYNFAYTGSGTFETILILNVGHCTTGVGVRCDWTQGRVEVRGYGLEVNLGERPNPYFANLPIIIPVPAPTAPFGTTLYENSRAGTFVYRIRGRNQFTYSDVIDPDLTYSITAGGTCPANLFTIDAVTGIIRTSSAGYINFEDYNTLPPCPCTSACTLAIQVSEGPFTQTEKLTIDIQNVNEQHTLKTIPGQETVDANTALKDDILHAVQYSDIDENRADVKYRIIYSFPPNHPFSEVFGKILISQDMKDWNGPTRYVLGLVSHDDIFGDGPKELTVVITNLRTKPIITNVDHTITIPENSAAGGTTVFDVNGTSQPVDGRGDPIAFYIMKTYPLNTSVDTFSIDAGTGLVTHKANPGFDYFGTRLYDIELEIRDSDPNMHIGDRTNLSVEITWVNQPPSHTATGFSATIDELSPIGTVLPGVQLEATDRDIQIGDWIDYLLSGTGSYLFYANNVTNQVYVLDEIAVTPGLTQDVYSLNVLVFDSHGESDSVPLVITVLDINDNAPVFNPDYYTGTISETAVGGTTTGVILTSTDQDGGKNAEIRYSIVEQLGRLYFEVDTSGVITNKQPIPYEVYQNMTFTVLAADRGRPPLNDTANVYIDITESNTNEPYFKPVFDSIDLRSDTPAYQVIYSVSATDADTSAVQNVTYDWLIIQDYFGFDGNSGKISLDREVRPKEKYLLYIAAQDHGQPVSYHSDQFTLRIDTYQPESTLIDIYLNIPTEQFALTVNEFMTQLDQVVAPWDMRLESYILKGSDTVVRVYAVESDLPDLEQNQDITKIFIDEDDLLKILRKNLQGYPTDVLLGSNFAEWKPYEVQPAYPVWIIDTPGGVAFLCILCILAVAGLITMFVLLAKKNHWCCYKYRPRITPRKVQPVSDNDNFKLNYIPDNGSQPPYYISDNKMLANTYSGIFPTKTVKGIETPPEMPGSRGPIRTWMSSPVDNDRFLTPVQTPDPPADGARPPPRDHGGQTA